MQTKSGVKRLYCPPQVRDYGKITEITKKGSRNLVVDNVRGDKS